MKIAVFITPHGFGHAARASAVMEAIHQRTGAEFQIFTGTPETFFQGLLTVPFRHHPLETDIGFRQASALEMDLEATVAALDAFREGLDQTVATVARKVEEAGCEMTLADISPLGILVAEALGLPSVLLENFTWDWIYEPLVEEAPGLAPHAAWFRQVYDRAHFRFQAAPACRPLSDAWPVSPVAREPRRSREAVRRELGIPQDTDLTLLTLGGVPQALPFLESLKGSPGHFLVTGGKQPGRDENLTFFSLQEPVYTPDLMLASDRVVAKLGYSTAAEAWLLERPLIFVANDAFRETRTLRPFLQREMTTLEVSMDRFLSGAWLSDEWLLANPAAGDGPRRRNGALEIAEALATPTEGSRT